MGTQQILMIVLSVIVVGAAVAVGIQMFDNQSRNQARAAKPNLSQRDCRSVNLRLTYPRGIMYR